jgi:hypothetical protein
MKNSRRITSILAITGGGILLVIALVLAGFWFGVPDERLLVSAASRDNLAEFKRIAAKGVSLDAQDQGMLGHTPLIATTLVQGTNVFFYLLTAGAKVDARGSRGETALMTAAMLGDHNLVKIKALIAAGADVNARDTNGASALDYVKWASAGHPTAIAYELLRQHGPKD